MKDNFDGFSINLFQDEAGDWLTHLAEIHNYFSSCLPQCFVAPAASSQTRISDILLRLALEALPKVIGSQAPPRYRGAEMTIDKCQDLGKMGAI